MGLTDIAYASNIGHSGVVDFLCIATIIVFFICCSACRVFRQYFCLNLVIENDIPKWIQAEHLTMLYWLTLCFCGFKSFPLEPSNCKTGNAKQNRWYNMSQNIARVYKCE